MPHIAECAVVQPTTTEELRSWVAGALGTGVGVVSFMARPTQQVPKQPDRQVAFRIQGTGSFSQTAGDFVTGREVEIIQQEDGPPQFRDLPTTVSLFLPGSAESSPTASITVMDQVDQSLEPDEPVGLR
jgi:hypothetical protein